MRLRVHGKLYFDWFKITARSDSFLRNIDHVCKYSLPPRTIIHCYHGNKNVATSKKGIFFAFPRVPNCMQNLKGSWKFSFPKLFDSYRDSFLTAIVCNFRTFVGLFIFVIRYGSNHEMDIKRFQFFLLAKKTGSALGLPILTRQYGGSKVIFWIQLESYHKDFSKSRDICETIFPSP